MLTISNLYAHGFDRAQLDRLEGLGFSLRPEVSTYAGSQRCSFLDFAEGPALELIEVTDRADYESFVPGGMEPYCPGISLVADDGSQRDWTPTSTSSKTTSPIGCTCRIAPRTGRTLRAGTT